LPTRYLAIPILFVIIGSLLLAACASSREAERYTRQADQFVAEGRLAEAVLTYRQALVSDPDNPDVLARLGYALAAQGRRRLAYNYLSQAALIKPDDPDLQTALRSLSAEPSTGIDLSLAWIAAGVGSEPVGLAADSGKVFAAYHDGRLIALDQASGGNLWEVQALAGLASPPAVDSDQVWVGSEDGSVYVFEAATGRLSGSFLTGGPVYAAPALTAEFAFCPSNDGYLYALERAGLNLVWKAATDGALHVGPLATGQAIYVGSNDGRLYALRTDTGERIWSYGVLTQGAVESVPILEDARILVGSGDGRLYALAAESGGEYWRYSTPDAIYASPLVLGEQVIVASSGNLLASVNLLDGSPDWSLPFEHPLTQKPVFYKDRLYLAAHSDPLLYAVDYKTGTLQGAIDTGDWIAFGPLEAGDDLILLGKDGAVILYR
jgi:outer membrane protein assembly factor BamB